MSVYDGFVVFLCLFMMAGEILDLGPDQFASSFLCCSFACAC